MSKNLYIVPFDFTPVSEKALEYALFLGKRVQTEIRLLHLATDKAKGMAMLQKLEEVKEKTPTPDGCEITTQARVGNIFTDIGKVAKEAQAQLIIMGTHGMKGFQSVTGSNAMKVITSAECPFLIVQQHTDIQEIRNIAVPIDLTKESLQIVNIAGDLATMFGAKVHVIAEEQSDQILNTRIKNRIQIVSQQYEDRNVSASVQFVKKRGGFGKKVMNFSKDNEVDMVAIAYHSESLFPQFDGFAQNLMTNKVGLPLLVINSKLASSLYF